MIALAVVVIASTGLGMGISELRKARLKSEYIQAVAAIEASMTESMVNENLFTDPEVKAALKSGTLPYSFVLSVSGESTGKPFSFGIRAGDTVNLDSNFNICDSYPTPPCGYQIKLGVSNVGGRAAFTYTVQSGFTDMPLVYEAGVNSSVSIPYEFYLDNLNLFCPTATYVGVQGVDRASGKVNCIRQPASTCGPGTLPKALRLQPGSEPSLELTK